MAVTIEQGYIRTRATKLTAIDVKSIKGGLVLELLAKLDSASQDTSTRVTRVSFVEQRSKWTPALFLNTGDKVFILTVLYLDRNEDSHLYQCYYNTNIEN